MTIKKPKKLKPLKPTKFKKPKPLKPMKVKPAKVKMPKIKTRTYRTLNKNGTMRTTISTKSGNQTRSTTFGPKGTRSRTTIRSIVGNIFRF